MEYKVEQVIKENRMYILNDEPFSLSVPEGVDTIYVPEGTAEGYKALNPTVSDYIKNYSYSNYRVTKPEFYDDVTVIMDKTTNAPVLKVMYENGLCANENYMTLAEAKAVTNETLPSFKGNLEITSFMEFQYFTGITETKFEMFFGCNNLERVELPKTCRKISDKFAVFSTADLIAGKESKLSYVGGVENVEYVGQNAFQYCYNIKELNFTSKLKTIVKNAFSGIYTRLTKEDSRKCHLESVGDLSGVETMGDYAFQCQSELRVVNPTSVTSLGVYVFASCPKLHPILNWAIIQSMSNGVFSYQSTTQQIDLYVDDFIKLNAVIETVPDMPNLTSMGIIAFQNKHVKYVGNMPNLKTLGKGVFNIAYNLRTVGSMESLEVLPSMTFGTCYNLQYIKDLSSLKEIGESCFSNNVRLNQHFPNVEKVGDKVFQFYDKENPSYEDFMEEIFDRTISFGKSYDEITWGTTPFLNNKRTTIICNGVELTEEQYSTLGATKPNSETVENIVEEPAEK